MHEIVFYRKGSLSCELKLKLGLNKHFPQFKFKLMFIHDKSNKNIDQIISFKEKLPLPLWSSFV